MAQQSTLLAWVEAGIPVTLLLDLADVEGLDSRSIYADELEAIAV